MVQQEYMVIELKGTAKQQQDELGLLGYEDWKLVAIANNMAYLTREMDLEWEYLVLDLTTMRSVAIPVQGFPEPEVFEQETLNRLGKDEWELVGVNNENSETNRYAHLKRKRRVLPKSPRRK